MSLDWNNSYRIGDAEIDAQHQQLFALVNTFLLSTNQADLTATAMGLFKYTREHFAHEESLMKRVKYPAMAAHVKQHDALLSKLNLAAQSIADGSLDSKQLELFLRDWLLNHIGESDTKLAKFVLLENRNLLPNS